ncbi:hypothetical protein CHLRE_16g652226v5 [Chlamydomonas reinhardtii]|uniref:Uncharacterized protein n=1 Tax=Chlamydomonas reinhardtii TaxID=3055 RepID=A0A2K3CSZ3_CHLRE|nr:uncharacterized protein CHLRE_16g652226v5 [Chlamydomonas reinhardtii]PNW71388.1 hypothetical protein CHLRE_16g652226v5 [Chlamydomonas reinhardtii]
MSVGEGAGVSRGDGPRFAMGAISAEKALALWNILLCRSRNVRGLGATATSPCTL